MKPFTISEIQAKASLVHKNYYLYIGFGEPLGTQRTLRIQCPKHGEFTQRQVLHLKGAGCPECGKEAISLSKRITLEQAAARARIVHGSVYEYKSIVADARGKSTITYQCSTHGEITQRLNDHLSGHGCTKCGYLGMGKPGRDTLESFSVKARAVHGELYVYKQLIRDGSKAKFVAVCSAHGEFTQNLNTHLSGSGCPACGVGRSGLAKRYSLEDYVERANAIHRNQFTYANLLYTEDRLRSSVELLCPTHGLSVVDAKDHLLGSGCPKCSNRISKPCTEIYDWLVSLGLECQREIRLGTSSLVWDIVIPSKLLAIEYHGLYWHSSKYVAPGYHAHKHKQGLEAGYRTIHIFSDEWEHKQERVKGLLLAGLGLLPSKVFARKCSVQEVKAPEARAFLDLNHIQGYVSSSHYLGLYLSGTLEALLGYERRESGRKEHSDGHLEITRYASTSQVVGGFSKLLNHLIKQFPEATKVQSFSDVRLYSGNMYKVCGFVPVYQTKPDYAYTDGKTRKHKVGFQKSRFKLSKSLEYVEGLTEVQLAALNKLYRVYDCGKIKWVKTV